MRDQIFYNWTWLRAIYVVLGLVVLYESISDLLVPGIMIGGYFFTMGILGLGCTKNKCER